MEANRVPVAAASSSSNGGHSQTGCQGPNTGHLSIARWEKSSCLLVRATRLFLIPPGPKPRTHFGAPRTSTLHAGLEQHDAQGRPGLGKGKAHLSDTGCNRRCARSCCRMMWLVYKLDSCSHPHSNNDSFLVLVVVLQRVRFLVFTAPSSGPFCIRADRELSWAEL